MMSARRVMSRTLAVAAAALALAAAACGGDDEGAADASPPDAMPLPDATPQGSGMSAWEMVSCGVDPFDAAPEPPPEFDAGPGDPPDGLGDPCCDPTGGCNSGMECIRSTASEEEVGSCRPNCAGESGLECPFGGVCADFSGQKVCIEAGGEGADCAPELCQAGTICVGDDADSATCHRKCMDTAECEDGQTCETLTGSTSKACI